MRREGEGLDAAGRYVWTPARRQMLIELYLERGVGATAIAMRLGPPATREIVQHKITAMGLAARRPEDERQQRRLDALDLAARARHRKRAARGQVVWTEAAVAALRRMYLAEETPPALIARALGFPVLAVRRKIKLSGLAKERRAMGKPRLRARRLAEIPGLVVQRLPGGVAAGVSRWETTLRAAPPPEPAAAGVKRRRAQANSRRSRELRATAARWPALASGAATPGVETIVRGGAHD